MKRILLIALMVVFVAAYAQAQMGGGMMHETPEKYEKSGKEEGWQPYGYGPCPECGTGYGPGYGMMGPGMMGGYGPGCGMMGPGYGHMGPGMMGGYGPGYGMGPGMMRGYGPGYGMGPGMMWGYGPENRAFLDKTRDLRKKLHDRMFDYMEMMRDPDTPAEKLRDIRKELSDLQWQIMEKARQ